VFLTKSRYLQRVEELEDIYWKRTAEERWKYMQVALHWLVKLNPQSMCEAGTNGMQLNTLSTVLLDYPLFDLNQIPYPFTDKQFDCFVALQVWEHLKEQKKAFTEAKRISKNIILSVPYLWTSKMTRYTNHRDIGRRTIKEWAGGIPPTRFKIVGEKSKIVCLWRFEKE
jgi:hypothetical protein